MKETRVPSGSRDRPETPDDEPPPPGDPPPAGPQWIETNRRWWDERAAVHEASAFYDIDSFLRDPDRLRRFEVDEVGPVDGRTLVHLQCHNGLDTLSWATRGARVVGLDFSAPAIESARRTASALGYDDGRAEFVVADVYDAVAALDGRTFDVVYTGLGALNWLPDLERWAAVAAQLVAPGGVLYVAELHPLTWIFTDDDLTVAYDYFDGGAAYPAAGTYTGDEDEFDADVEVVRNVTIGEVVTGVARQGLVVEHLGEHALTMYQRWPFLERDGHTWHMPADRPALPLLWSLRARRPDHTR